MALDATLKGASANSYASRANANTYFGDRLGVATTWDGASDASKDASLVMSTRYLDNMMYRGERTTTTQKLSFPRQFLPDPDSTAVFWGQQLRLRTDYFDVDTIPDRVLFATYELAFRLLSDNELLGDPSLRQFADLNVQGVVSLTVNKSGLPRVIDRQIIHYISPLLKSGDPVSVKMKR